MASDYKESSNNARSLLCLVLWVFPLIPALHPVISAQETAFANDPMHACDTRIRLLDKCVHIEGITENPQQSNLCKHDVYWNTSHSHCNLTKNEMCQPWQTVKPSQQEVDTALLFPRSSLSDFFPPWMLMICCMTIILDDVIHAIIPWLICLLSSEGKRVPSPRCRTTVISNPLLRVCQFAFLLGTCILALGQGIPLWNWPKAIKAPAPRQRRQNDPKDNGFALQGVFLKSTQPQQVVRTFSTIGDGNCFWRAVARNLPIKWYTLKRCVLGSALRDPNCTIDKIAIRHLMKKNQWADSTAIQLTATFLECNLAVWHKGGIGFFPTTKRNADTIFLSLSRHHFESIPAKTGIKLLATCDPMCPIPVQALPFYVGSEYSETSTIPCRTLKISRVGYFERFSFAPPHQFVNPGNIGLGLLMKDNPQSYKTSHSTSQSKENSKHHSRKKDYRRTARDQRHTWPIWYLVLMLLLRFLGNCNPAQNISTFQDPNPLNLSSFTICGPNTPYKAMDTLYPRQSLTDPTSTWIHEDQSATQPSSRTIAVANAEAQHVLDTCYGCTGYCKQYWPFGYNCSKESPNYQNSSLPIPVHSPFTSHHLLHNLLGGFGNNIPGPQAAMVVTRAEILLEKQLRSLRSQMDSGEAIASREIYENLHRRHQAVHQALNAKRMARDRSRTPIRRRTRREVNRLMRGDHENAGREQAGAALEQPQVLCRAKPSEPATPPPWFRTATAEHQQVLIETMGTNPDRAMSASTFNGQADVVVQVRLHAHQDPGRDPRLHAHTGRHQATLKRVANSQAMQHAFSAVLGICKHKRRIFVEVQCKQGRHRSVAAAECLEQLFRIQNQRTTVEVHHRGAQNNWYTLCQVDTCVECSMYKAQSRQGLGLRAELHAVLSPCLTMQVTKHPYVYVGERRSYMMCPTQPCCSNIQDVTCRLTWPQDNGGAHFEDALEHPRTSATPALIGGCKLKTTLSHPNCPQPYFKDPFLKRCLTERPLKSSPNLLGKDDVVQLQGLSFKKLRCLVDHCRFKQFNLEYLSKSTTLFADERWCQHNDSQVIQFNLDRQFSDLQKDSLSKNSLSCPPHLTPHYHHNSGCADEAVNEHHAISCNHGGTPPLRFKGLPKHPYGVHLSGGCIGAAHTTEGDHCKSLGDGLPQPLFGFFGSLFSRLFHTHNRSLNLGCDSKCCSDVKKTNTMVGSRTKNAHWCFVVITCLKVAYSPQLCCTSFLTCICSKEYNCNSHDHDAITLAAVHENLYCRFPHPWVELEGGFLTDNIIQLTSPLSAYNALPCLQARSSIMPASPAELLLERQMIRLRSDLQHGPVQEDAQLIADMERQYRDLQEDLDNRRADRSRSREPIRRRTQYELNRLMRGQAPKAAAAKPAVAKPKGAVNRPVTPPKSPPPVRPETPPKSPPNAPPLTVYSAPVNPVPRPSAPLTPVQPSYPPPKAASDSQTMPKATAKTAGVPKQPSTPPPTSARTAWVPKPPPTPSTPPPSSAASSPTRSITAKLVVSKARPKARPSAPSTAAAPSTTSAEVPSSSKAPALPLRQASAPNVGPPPPGKKIYIESYGLRPDNPMAPSQSHPDVQLDVYVDLRRLHNPQQNRSLRSHTGLHKDTILEIARHHEIPRVLALILQQCNAYDCIHVHVACTQGRHRSVGFSGILRQAVLSQMPQALVFVAHRAAQNNWGPLCGLLRCEACSVFRSLSPEGQALRNKVATAISSCFTLAVNSHSYVQLVPRYMLACLLCVPDLTCLRLLVQPAQDRQYNPPLSGGALERHRSRSTATPYNAKPPCWVWFWVLFTTSPSLFRPWPHYSLLACKDQICHRRCHTATQPVGLANIDPGDASYVPSYFPKPLGNGIRFDLPASSLGFRTSKIGEVQNHYISTRSQFVGGGDEEEQHLVPFWDAFDFDSPQTHNSKSPSSSQPLPVPNPTNMPPFWEALDIHAIPICDNISPVSQFNHPEDLDDHISAAQDDTFVYDDHNDFLQENYSPCPSTAIDSPTSSESLTQPYHYNHRTCPNSPSFELHYSSTPLAPKGIKRKFVGNSSPHTPHHHHQDEDLQTRDHVRHDHNDDDHLNDVDGISLHHHCNHDEERSPSITSSYIGSVQNFLVQQGPYPGWEYDEAFVQVDTGQLQLPLIFIPSSPEPPSSELSPSNASSIERAGHDHWDAWSQDSDRHLHARQPDTTNSATSRLPSQCHTPPEFDPWDQVPTQDFLDIMGEHDENPSEASSHPSLSALLWENKPDSPMQGGAKHKNEGLANVCTEAEISRQVQRIKDLSHGLVSKQLRLLLKGDSKFYKKIVRTTNEEHLLSCILAEAKRVGLNPAANTPEIIPVVQPGRGKGPSHQESPKGKDNGKNPKGDGKGKSSYDPRQQKGHEKGKGKDEPRNKGTSKGQDGKTKGKGKGISGSSNTANRSTFSIVPDGWNVLPAVEFNGTNGGIYAIENEDDARKLAESAANASFPVAILSPKPLGVGIGAPRPLDVEFFESKNGVQQIVTLHTYLHQLTQYEAKYAKNARVVQINRPTEARAQIVYLKYTDQGASTQMRIDLQDKRSHQHKTWIQSIINAPNPIQLQDLWHIQDAGVANGIRYYTASARVPSEQVPTALNISQPGRIQTNIPAHIRQEIRKFNTYG